MLTERGVSSDNFDNDTPFTQNYHERELTSYVVQTIKTTEKEVSGNHFDKQQHHYSLKTNH